MRIRKASLRKIISESIKKKLLVENSGILSMLDKLLKAYPKIHLNLELKGGTSGEIQIFSGAEKILYMSIMESSGRSLNSHKRLQCNNAFEVTWVENDSGLGIGPLIYDIAIELLSIIGSGLKPDSSAVSHPVFGSDPEMGDDHGFANNIWLYILSNRSDLQKTKIDPYPFSFTKNKKDDCWPASMLDNWYADRHPEYKKFFKSAMKKRKGKFYPSSKQTHKWLKKYGEGGPAAYETWPGYGGVDTYDWWDRKSRVNKKYIDKVMPKAHRDEFKSDWNNNEIPLSFMVSKNKFPILKKMASKGIKINSNWPIFSKSISFYNKL